jgi:uncharacterized protein (DUF58 family)
LHGIHQSQQRGSGIEFHQYRAYEPGDPLALIDWKLFARSDRYYVRDAQRESNLQVWVLIDASASMLHRSEVSAKGTWHKLDYAKHLAATLSYLAQQQGDTVGLLNLHADKTELVPAMAGYQHWQRCVLHLSKLQAGSTFPQAQTLLHQIAKVRERGLIIVLSDFYQENQEINDFMGRLVSPRTDVIAMQLLSKDEQNFPYKGSIRFKDRESQRSITLSGKAAKEAYLQAFEEFNQDIKTSLQSLDIEHESLNIDEPMDAALRRFLKARLKRS